MKEFFYNLIIFTALLLDFIVLIILFRDCNKASGMDEIGYMDIPVDALEFQERDSNAIATPSDDVLDDIQPFDLKSLAPDPWVVFGEKEFKYVERYDIDIAVSFDIIGIDHDMFREYVLAARSYGWTDTEINGDVSYVAYGQNHHYEIEIYYCSYGPQNHMVVIITFLADR